MRAFWGPSAFPTRSVTYSPNVVPAWCAQTSRLALREIRCSSTTPFGLLSGWAAPGTVLFTQLRALVSDHAAPRLLQVSFLCPRQAHPVSLWPRGARGSLDSPPQTSPERIWPRRRTAAVQLHYRRGRCTLPTDPGTHRVIHGACNVSIVLSSAISFQISACLQESAGELIRPSTSCLLSLAPGAGISPIVFIRG